MCGIAGIYSLKNKTSLPEDILLKMISILQHRGPDETGIYLDNAIGLANARLSIIGLDDGTQPLCNEDSTLWIVYNGETFNYIELKEELIQRGHRFSTHSDTEVILHLYEEYGPRCLEKINGEFAIAIWDSVKKELFLARDRVGIKPLFFTRAKGKFLFASEIKALFQDPEVSREIDPEALVQVFTFWTTVTPKTAFKGVFELPPGHFMKIDGMGEMTPKPYWRIPYYPAEEQWRGTFDEAQEELRRLLKDAVALRLRADVPVGAYLSGGLDSSILSSLICRNFNNRLRTFSLSFQEKPFDEFSFQKEMVQLLGTEHSQVEISNNQIRENFPQVVWLCEKPLLRTGPVPLYLLSKLVRESQFKVVLTGEGADEVFGGYNIFKEAKLRNFWRKQPDSKCRPMLVERLYPYIFKNPSRARFFLQQFFSPKQEDVSDPFFSHRPRWRNGEKNMSFFSEGVRENLSKYNPYRDLIGRLPQSFSVYDVFSKTQFLEMDIFLSNYLLSSQGDRVSMGNSIELRLPYLDYRVMEFAAKIPANWKIKVLNEKYILKQTFQEAIPERIRNRAKQPYRAPIREALLTGGPDSYVKTMLSERYLGKTGYFNEKKVGHLIAKFEKNSSSPANETQNMALVGILSTQLLHQQFIDEFQPANVKPLRPDKIVRKNNNSSV